MEIGCCWLTLKRCDVGQKCCFSLRGEQEFMYSLDVPLFSHDASVSRKDLHVLARHKLLFPSQWETTFEVYEDMMEVLLVLEIFLTEDL